MVRNYPHIGPGNKILSKANNPLDNIARNHDIAYTNAKTAQDIIEADRIFIDSMKNQQPDTWSGSAIKHLSKAGIQIKTNIEQASGKILYPSNINKGMILYFAHGICTRRYYSI